MFTSDHGDMQSDHWLWRKGYPWDGSTHIPMILKWPGSKPNQTTSELVELRDVFPTFIESAGGNHSKMQIDGSSLWSLIRGETWRNHLDFELGLAYSQSNNTLTWNGILTKKYKYIYFAKE